MLAGTFAMNMYNLTNAWFVAKLGTEALAAISFTFPVVMLLMFVTRGLSGGALTLVAHAIGAKDRAKAATLTTHALVLAALFGALVCGLGLLTVSPLFSRLGASGQVVKAARQLVAQHGEQMLPKVAKMHFKTTQSVLK